MTASGADDGARMWRLLMGWASHVNEATVRIIITALKSIRVIRILRVS